MTISPQTLQIPVIVAAQQLWHEIQQGIKSHHSLAARREGFRKELRRQLESLQSEDLGGLISKADLAKAVEAREAKIAALDEYEQTLEQVPHKLESAWGEVQQHSASAAQAKQALDAGAFNDDARELATNLAVEEAKLRNAYQAMIAVKNSLREPFNGLPGERPLPQVQGLNGTLSNLKSGLSQASASQVGEVLRSLPPGLRKAALPLIKELTKGRSW